MTRPILALLVALLAGACTAHRSGSAASQTASTAPAAQASADKSSTPGLVCRSERPTGSNIVTRVCYTQEEIDAMSLSAQDAHRRATANILPPRGN
jgi:hypothetical protein